MNADHCLMVCSATLILTILVLITVAMTHRKHLKTQEMVMATPAMMYSVLMHHDASKGDLKPSSLAGDRIPYGTSSDGTLSADDDELHASSTMLERAKAAVHDIDMKKFV